MKIAPSVLAADITQLGLEIKKVSNSDYIHLDIMDGHFVPNISYGPAVVSALRNCTDIPFDVHLMLSHPLKYIEDFAKAGADIISFHSECNDDILEVVEKIESFGIKPALAIKPNTKIDEVLPFVDRLFMVLVMTVEPGFGGQSFMEKPLEKVAELKNKCPNLLVQVDGGVSRENINLCKKAGVDICVCGTSVFKSSNPKEEIEFLQKV